MSTIIHLSKSKLSRNRSFSSSRSYNKLTNTNRIDFAAITPRRVVVTGVGMITPLGVTTAETWKAILNSQSGIKKIEQFDTSDLACKIAGSVKRGKLEGEFEVEKWISKSVSSTISPFIELALCASKQAIDDSNLKVKNEEHSERIVSFSTLFIERE